MAFNLVPVSNNNSTLLFHHPAAAAAVLYSRYFATSTSSSRNSTSPACYFACLDMVSSTTAPVAFSGFIQFACRQNHVATDPHPLLSRPLAAAWSSLVSRHTATVAETSNAALPPAVQRFAASIAEYASRSDSISLVRNCSCCYAPVFASATI